MSVVYFVVCLPIAVWVLAPWVQLLDDAPAESILRRIIVRTGVVALGIILFGTSAAAGFLSAVVMVLALHLGWFYLARWLMARDRFNARNLD